MEDGEVDAGQNREFANSEISKQLFIKPSSSAFTEIPVELDRHARRAHVYQQPSKSAQYKSAVVAAFFATPCVALPKSVCRYQNLGKQRKRSTSKVAKVNCRPHQKISMYPYTPHAFIEASYTNTGLPSKEPIIAEPAYPLPIGNTVSEVATSECAAAAEAMLLLRRQQPT
jgi:hypothetical protein